MSHPPHKKRDSLLDLPMPRDPKLPPTQVLVAREHEEEETGVRQAPRDPFDDVTLPLVEAATLDDAVSEEIPDDVAEAAPSWDEATLVDTRPEE